MTGLIIYDVFAPDLMKKVHNLDTDTLKIALSNRAPVVATDDEFADIVELSATNGYTAGGLVIPDNVVEALAGGHARLTVGANVQFVSNTGNVGPFQYSIVYNATTATGRLIGYWDRGYPLTLDGTQGHVFTINWSFLSEVLRLVKGA